METIEVSTTVYVSPERAYAFLRDFERYSDYSKYVKSVTADGDAGEGTEYEIRFGWWKLSYGVRTVLTELSPPSVIGWKTCSDIDAHGRWEIATPDSEGEDPPGSWRSNERHSSTCGGQEPDGDVSTVSLVVTYDADSVTAAGIDLPTFVSLDWVVDRVVGLIEEEGRRVVERVVAELEGERRPVDLLVEHRGKPGTEPSQ